VVKHGDRGGDGRGLDDLAPEFFLRVAEIVNAPSTLAGSLDLAFPQTKANAPKTLQSRLVTFRHRGPLTGATARAFARAFS
jgi:hypothetical protein